jgi:hypothetical protein
MTLSDSISPHRDVKLRFTKAQQLAYRPPKGINVLFYGPNKTNLQIPEDEVYATFYVPELDPEEEFQKYLDDIDEELSKLKVLKDHVTIADEPKLIDPHVEVHVLIDKVKDNPRYQKYLTDMDAKKERIAKLTNTPEEDVTTVRL